MSLCFMQIVITEGLQFLETLGWKVVRFHPELSVTEDKGGECIMYYHVIFPELSVTDVSI